MRNSSTVSAANAENKDKDNGDNTKLDRKRTNSILEDKAAENVDDIKKLKIKKLDTNISYAFESCLSQNEFFLLKNEPLQILRDCFSEGTAPKFQFSKKINENNYVRSCKWFVFLNFFFYYKKLK